MLENNTTKNLNIVLINFSSRFEKGNGYSISQYIKEQLNSSDSKLTIKQFNYCNLNVNPCGVCDYQCFKNASDCPYIEDDIKSLYEAIINCNVCIYIIPIYSDYPCSNFFLFRERSQCIFNDDQIYDKYLNVNKRFIVIGNTGFEQTKTIIQNDYKDSFSSNHLINIKSSDVKEKSIKGNLITYNYVSEKIDFLLNDVLQIFKNT